jgi:hypothetical protein
MNGPDYVQWHGFYEVAKIFYSDFLPEAEHLLPGATSAVKESSYHQWLKISEGFKGRHGGLTLTLSPHKTSRNHEAPSISEHTYQVRPRSVAVLWVSLSEVTQRVTDP